ncbi:ABC transporter ATP-binding protein [Bryobacterales bacterium F-183]|nr:ABC transporter ATP-binding protein [Bryobacterales bacterium F-183]
MVEAGDGSVWDMKNIWRFLVPYYARYKKQLVLGFGSLILKDAFHVAQPLVIRNGIDSLQKSFAMEGVFWFAATLVALSIAKGIFQYWMRVILIGVSRDIEYDLRNDLFGHLTKLSAGFFSKYRTGDIMARSTNDLNAVRMMLGPGLMYWTETGLTLILSIAVMSIVDWRLTLMALIPAPFVSIAVIFFGRRIHERFEKIQEMFSSISSRVQENLSGVRVIRAYVQEKHEIEMFERMNQDYIAHNIRLARISGMFYPLLQSLVGLTFLTVLLAGGARMLDGKLSAGSFVMFNTYMGMLIWPMIAVGWVVNLIQRGRASVERIQQLLREEPAIAAPAKAVAMPAEGPRGEIRFEKVSLAYGDAGYALQDLELTIPAGATVALVGHTGSGKTSVIQMIPRMMDPTTGRVMVDGVDVREYDPKELRRHIAVVPQETFLFSTTIAENIALGVEKATAEEIAAAAEIAGLGPDIAGFPQGLDTKVGERGLTLSGGQKQRTAIARAVLRNPRILILDDALSAVDTVTEERVLQGLAGVMQGRTTILISHRVSTVRNADRIFVLRDGKVAEQGTHEELLGIANGYYAELHQRQLLEDELETTA